MHMFVTKNVMIILISTPTIVNLFTHEPSYCPCEDESQGICEWHS